MPGLLAATPAYTSILIIFDPLEIARQVAGVVAPAQFVLDFLKKNLKNWSADEPALGRLHEIPVRYGGEFGEDLEALAEQKGLKINDLIDLHCSVEYDVYMIGFLPGFPYLGVLPEALRFPRRATPRLRVPTGSVAIAGLQTGIYPQSSPGGWHLIGRTDFVLFDAFQNPPARLQAGDRVRFLPM